MNPKTQEDRLAKLDFQAHNEEVRKVWSAFRKKSPFRVPMILGVNTRFFMADPLANPEHLTFQEYMKDPDLMFRTRLKHQRWNRFNLLQDAELGLPERWTVSTDFQNFYEAAWLGCEIKYYSGEVPDTRPRFSDRPEDLLDQGIPDSFGGFMAQVWEFYERFKELAKKDDFLGRPVDVQGSGEGLGSDGPLTVACNLMGPEVILTLMALEPVRAERILGFITQATIQRISAWRKRLGLPQQIPRGGFADDSLALISTPMYKDHVLPHHRRLYDALCLPKGRSIHLCGDSTRHFPLLRDELGIRLFDTGFPVDFADLRRTLGPKITISGGPKVELLRTATPKTIRQETQRILESGILEGGRFILREGNNLAPGTPLENTEAMYRACQEFGQLK